MKHNRIFKRFILYSFIAIAIGLFLVFGVKPFFSKIFFPHQNYNVVIVSLTALKQDHLSFAGYNRLVSPNIDNLAKRSLVFKNAYTVSNWTLPANVSLFTSLYPYTHKVMNRSSYLDEKITTMVDVLKKAGYDTASFTGGFDYDPVFGVMNRFDENISPPLLFGTPREPVSYDERLGKITISAQRAISWLKNNQKTKPFFLFVQGYDPHCPYTPSTKGDFFDPDYKGNIDFSGCIQTISPAQSQEINGEKVWQVFNAPRSGEKPYSLSITERDVEHLVALYDEEIYEADNSIGNLLKTIEDLGLNENTIIIFLAEHGEYIGEHGQFMRGGAIKGKFGEEALHIPLMIYFPKIQAKEFSQLVSIIDIAPTISDILGIRGLGNVQGKSFYSLIRGVKDNINDAIYAGSVHTPSRNNFFFNKKSATDMIIEENWKLIHEEIFDDSDSVSEEKWKLYDLQKDPEENNSLIDDYPSVVETLKGKLFDWRKSTKI